MKILFLLNGGSMRKFPANFGEVLARIARERGHDAQVATSRSLEHLRELVGKASERHADLVLVGGGDGTLQHVIAHPASAAMVLAPLPLGTVNAFLRAAGVDARDPRAALRQILRGRVVDGYCGRVNGQRFACFASFGFDARVIHSNPPWLKARLREASFGVTGLVEVAMARKRAVPGWMRVAPDARFIATSSAVFSKIRNYAGVHAFRVSAEAPELEGIAAHSDRIDALLGMAAAIAFRLPAKGKSMPNLVRHLPPFERAEWRSTRSTVVQLDGEAVAIRGADRLEIDTDPVPQRYMLP